MRPINKMRDRVQIQVKTITDGALGQTVVWKPVATISACVIPLKVEARAAYQQLNSVVSHKILLNRGSVDISLGNNRILHGDKIYEPSEPPQVLDNLMTIAVKEI